MPGADAWYLTSPSQIRFDYILKLGKYDSRFYGTLLSIKGSDEPMTNLITHLLTSGVISYPLIYIQFNLNVLDKSRSNHLKR